MMTTSPQNTSLGQKDIRKIQKNELKKNIEDTLLQFKFNDLIGETIVNLFKLQPVEINYKLNELKLPFKKQSVAVLLRKRSQMFQLEDLQDLSYLLKLYRVAFYYKQKTWTPINLLEPEEDFTCDTDLNIIRRNILQAFRIKGLNAVVKIITHVEMTWIVVIEKKLTKKKGVKLLTPAFVCYEIGTPYIFTASPIPDKIMHSLLRALHYKKHKLHQLEGRDVKSLLTILKNKAINSDIAKKTVYQPRQAKVGHRDIDFSQKTSREHYADNLFMTKEPVILETFKARAEAVWRDNELVPDMADEQFPVGLNLSSKNLVEMIKFMVVHEMLPTPLPEYVQTILRTGKNKIDMRVPGK